MVENYTIKHPDEIKGQILMGGSLLRSMRHNDNSTGLTVIETEVPTLVLAGSKDGLYRITRNAESYWHQVINITPSQKGKYPVILLKGASHASFQDETMMSSVVKASDLKADITQTVA
jgi:hypothetical protein